MEITEYPLAYPMLYTKYGDTLCAEELAEYLSVSVNTAYKMLRSRYISGRRVGREWRIPKSRIVEYLEKKTR